MENELHKLAPTLMKIERKDCFVVPENYFETLPQNISVLLLQQKSISTFSAPENYFETNLEKVNQLLLHTKYEAFETPQGYFETLPMRMAARIQPQEKLTLSAPEGYFDALPRMVQQRIYEENNKPKVIFWQPTYTYALSAIAACLILFFGVNNFLNDKIEQNIAVKIKPKNTITNQVTIQNNNNELNVKVASSTQKEIEKHFNENLINTIDESILIDELVYDNEPSETNYNSNANDEINNYLIENNIDETLLAEAVN